MDGQLKSEIINWLLLIIDEVAPGASRLSKYGGTLIEKVPGDTRTQFCGLFAYKAHVSLEFSHGVLLDDPGGYLEGNGKQRRHLKLRCLDDIEAKACRAFLIAAAANIP